MAECSGAEAAALQESVDLSGWIFPMECQIQEELKIITWLHLSKAAGYFSTQGNGTLGDPRLLEETQRSVCKEHDLVRREVGAFPGNEVSRFVCATPK